MNIRILTVVLVASCVQQTFGQANVIPSVGNVGIGITPLTKLHVKGDTRIERQSGGGNYFLFRSDAGGNYLISDDNYSNQKNMYLSVVSAKSGNNNTNMYFQTGIKDSTFVTRMTIRYNGNVGIGTTNPQAKLAVDGSILAREVKVKNDISVPDYVFEPDYKLATLAEIEAYVKEHKHLPEIPSAADIQREGLDLGEMNLILLKKVEELTLHLIEREKNERNMLRLLEELQRQIGVSESE